MKLKVCSVFLLCCAMSGCATTPTQPNNTVSNTSWKDYRNEEYGISLQYPADWIVEAENRDQPGFVSFQSPETKLASQKLHDEYLRSETWPPDFPITLSPDLMISYRASPPNLAETNVTKKVKEIPLGKTTATLMVDQTMGDYFYILAGHDGTYTFSLNISDPKELDESPNKEILSSFSFLRKP